MRTAAPIRKPPTGRPGRDQACPAGTPDAVPAGACAGLPHPRRSSRPLGASRSSSGRWGRRGSRRAMDGCLCSGPRGGEVDRRPDGDGGRACSATAPVGDEGAAVALEVAAVDRVEAHERREQPDVGLGERAAGQEAPAGEAVLEPVEGLEDAPMGGPPCLPLRREAGPVDPVVQVGVHPPSSTAMGLPEEVDEGRKRSKPPPMTAAISGSPGVPARRQARWRSGRFDATHRFCRWIAWSC